MVLLAGPLGASAAGSRTGGNGRLEHAAVRAAADDASANGVVVHVRDAAAGRVLVMAGEQSIEVEDHTLVQAVAQALRVGEG